MSWTKRLHVGVKALITDVIELVDAELQLILLVEFIIVIGWGVVLPDLGGGLVSPSPLLASLLPFYSCRGRTILH
ncbi:hypothetical protein VNO78_16027 [Psophocarpus tetragonolobus]|uniref:Uncharacterized protein n=1 Tax=Psophocarpus tetragonolobus TaxID=3891 RepID=A0AAN9SKF9_PSOTE